MNEYIKLDIGSDFIETPKIKSIYLNLDSEEFKDVEIISIKRNGKTLEYPCREFCQLLEKHVVALPDFLLEINDSPQDIVEGQ